MAERVRKPVASNDLISGAKYEWAKRYKTEIAESRLRKELGPLGNSPQNEVLISLKNFMGQTPPQFFSWTKWRDSWRAYLETELQSRNGCLDIFKSIMKEPTGYSPATGSYWLLSDIRKRFGNSAADAIEKIGGVKRLQNMTTDQKKWVEKAFIEAYNG